MLENKFDKENINIANKDDIPGSYMVLKNEKVYDIRENRKAWWRCPKCCGCLFFDSIEENFDESIGEHQFVTIYAWECQECDAHGTTFAIVNPLFTSIEDNLSDED